MSELIKIINIYIDGSCINNGSQNALAGYGVYFKDNDERNEYARVIGKQTNNTGELTALIRAIEIVSDELNKLQPNIKINIYTDSEYVIKCAGNYGDKLSKNDWKTSTGNVPPNLKLIQRIHEIYKPNKKCIGLYHIISDANKKAILDIEIMSANNEVNEEKIATDTGIDIEIHKKIYVKIPFKNKDAVKKLGCRWEPEKKSWYYMSNLEKNKIDSIKKLEA